MPNSRELRGQLITLCFVLSIALAWSFMFVKRPARHWGLDSLYGSMKWQLNTIYSQTELFRVKCGRYPDFSRGWDELISAGLLARPDL